MSVIIGLISGVIFAMGLGVSGMINPQKVLGFLDIFGHWDYSLAFVMLGAVGFNFVSFKVLQKQKPFCAPQHFLPTKTEIDIKLIVGSALFGIGWGLMGICPGPAIVNLVTLHPTILTFVASLILGMLLYKKTSFLWEKGDSK